MTRSTKKGEHICSHLLYYMEGTTFGRQFLAQHVPNNIVSSIVIRRCKINSSASKERGSAEREKRRIFDCDIHAIKTALQRPKCKRRFVASPRNTNYSANLKFFSREPRRRFILPFNFDEDNCCTGDCRLGHRYGLL